MSNGVNIKVERTGFPVMIGEVELWFDSSLENIEKFTKIEKLALKELKKVQKKFKAMELPQKVEDLDKLKEEDTQNVLELTKDFIAIQYELIFGKGSFDKVYKKYPDMFALEKAIKEASNYIAKEIEKAGDQLKSKA